MFLIREDAPSADLDTLERAHPRAHIDALIDQEPHDHGVITHLDPDTVLSGGSVEAARRAVGAVTLAVDGIMAQRWRNAFCAVRPPGHHAEPARAMGFCLFNSVVVGAYHARAVHGLRRIAVIDFDVHHGNGTQAFAEGDGDLFYASTHEAGIYPMTGYEDETGPAQNIVNAPLEPGAAGAQFRRRMEAKVLPALDAFAPDLIMVSAGFDAHDRDPLASLALTEADFAWATDRLCEAAGRHCEGRLVSCLEGGYDLSALARSASSHVQALMRAS